MESTVSQELYNSVMNYDEEAAKIAAEKAIQTEIDPYQAIVEYLTPAIKEVGAKFENGEVFLPHLVMAADAMTAAVKILEKKIPREKLESTKKGRIVLCTVKGDVAVSALMTFTAINMATIHEYMTAEGIRENYKLIFGGAPLTEEWAKEMGADAYALDAPNTVKVVNQIMGQ